MSLLQQFADDASLATLYALAALVIGAACVLTVYFVRFFDHKRHRIEMSPVAEHDRALTAAVEKLLRHHDFLTPHPGETCAEAGCAFLMDECRRLLGDDNIITFPSEKARR